LPALIVGAVIVGGAAFVLGTPIRAISASNTVAPAASATVGTDVPPQGAVSPDAGARPASAAKVPATNRRTNRAWCPECGVVESIVELERYADIGDHGMVPVNIDDDAKSDAKNRAHVAPARQYAMTVRFRDGSTTVFHEASARDWHPGVRVIVIPGGAATTP
jgi:hypothetical protein